MKYFIASKRSKAILGIGVVAVSIGLISKKLISYPSGDCVKGNQELSFLRNKQVLHLTNNLLDP